jgi:acylphosphatase
LAIPLGIPVIVLSKFRLQIFGKVQGVFYRQSAQEMAKSLSLNGWVKNLPDASVLLEAEGEKEKLEMFLAWCKQGPSRAKVDSVRVEWLDQVKDSKSEHFSAFKIIG